MEELFYHTVPYLKHGLVIIVLDASQTPYDSPWTEGYGIKVDGYTDAGKALYSFESWMQDNAALLPNFDSATIFSS